MTLPLTAIICLTNKIRIDNSFLLCYNLTIK